MQLVSLRQVAAERYAPYKEGQISSTPLLGRVDYGLTSKNRSEHAAWPFRDWGARSRRFKSRQLDGKVVFAGQTLRRAAICDLARSDLAEHDALQNL